MNEEFIVNTAHPHSGGKKKPDPDIQPYCEGRPYLCPGCGDLNCSLRAQKES